MSACEWSDEIGSREHENGFGAQPEDAGRRRVRAATFLLWRSVQVAHYDARVVVGFLLRGKSAA